MPSLSLVVIFLAVLSAFAVPVERDLEKRVDQSTYNTLVNYFQYASAAYQLVCPHPVDATMVTSFSDLITDTQGYIARDDAKKEIIVAFRGSSSLTDFLLTDLNIILTPLKSPGVTAPSGTLVHKGFLTAYNSVASEVISTVKSQLASHPGYSLVTTGHSLGGALSSLGAISLKQNFPNASIRMFTYGQPRIGNAAYAAFIDAQFGSKAYRAVHAADGVPTLVPTFLGYRHHGIEYWEKNSLVSSPANTKQCSGDEDPTCSASIPSGGINPDHVLYFGQIVAVDLTLCF